MSKVFNTSIDFAKQADAADELAYCKKQFHFPKKNGKDVIYFCGNSLGLQPINVEAAIQTELQSWRDVAVGGYFGGANPWLNYQDYMKPSLAKIVGCKESEVTVMNTLTVNLHLLMLSFYHPTKERYKLTRISKDFQNGVGPFLPTARPVLARETPCRQA